MSSSPTCDYEAERAKRIAENMRRLAELGVKETAAVIHAAVAPARRKPRAPRSPKPRFNRSGGGEPPRRSGRIDGLPARCYSVDLDTAHRELRKLAGPKRPASKGIRERVTSADEVYTQAHVDSLGTHTVPWELFVDGYDLASGKRIYDAVRGNTCHQCRQKTLGTHTSCDRCGRLSGIFCGDCLFMRYGENVLEANAASERARAARAASGSGSGSGSEGMTAATATAATAASATAEAEEEGWVCPPCRGLCNCSFHRARRGWAPTGSMYRYALSEGYASVAHYLVLTNLADGVVVPPGLKQGKKNAGTSSRPASAAAAAGAIVPDGPVTTTEARGGKPRSQQQQKKKNSSNKTNLSSSPQAPGSPPASEAKRVGGAAGAGGGGRGVVALRRRSLSSPSLPPTQPAAEELASPALEPAPVVAVVAAAAAAKKKRTGSFMQQIRINYEGFKGRGGGGRGGKGNNNGNGGDTRPKKKKRATTATASAAATAAGAAKAATAVRGGKVAKKTTKKAAVPAPRVTRKRAAAVA